MNNLMPATLAFATTVNQFAVKLSKTNIFHGLTLALVLHLLVVSPQVSPFFAEAFLLPLGSPPPSLRLRAE